jgi:Zn-dependent protease
MKIKLFEIFGVPFLVHWSLPLGSFFICYMFTYDVSKSFYISLTYIFLITAHELGHAIAIMSLRFSLNKVELFGFGGVCHCETMPTKRTDGLIMYSSGVLAQLSILIITLIYLKLYGHPTGMVWKDIVFTLVYINSILIVLNLIPSKLSNGFDSDGRMIIRFFKLK